MSETPDLHDAVARLDRALRQVGIEYALIGGFAVVMRGYPRFTQDVDAVLWDLDDRLAEVLPALETHGLTFRTSSGLELAKSVRVLLLQAPDGTGLDLSMGAVPFEREIIERATLEGFAGMVLPVATAEDLIIMKLVASRSRDRDDVARLLELHPGVDRARIRSVVSDFAAALESPEILEIMNALLAE